MKCYIGFSLVGAILGLLIGWASTMAIISIKQGPQYATITQIVSEPQSDCVQKPETFLDSGWAYCGYVGNVGAVVDEHLLKKLELKNDR